LKIAHHVRGRILLQLHHPATTSRQLLLFALEICCAHPDTGIEVRWPESTRDPEAFIELETEDASTVQLGLDRQSFNSFNNNRKRAARS
jgi:hypothetical protein